MNLTPFLILVWMMACTFANAQTNPLRIQPNILLPKDSIKSNTLISSLNGFLIAAQKPNEENKWVLQTEKAETFILLDEVNGIEKNVKMKDDLFYKPYLTNVVSLKDSQYLIQVSYIGNGENTALLRASFRFIAHKRNNVYLFTSLLLKNTQNWKTKQLGNNIIHYQNTINKATAKDFYKNTSTFDKKLKTGNKIAEYYCCENIIELMKLAGVDYKSDYNGRTTSAWSASSGNKKVIILGNNNAHFDHIDPHDLWHDRLSLVVPRNSVNRPVDEGCAYLYGGSWGLTWQEIFKEFKVQVGVNKNTNWAELKETPVYFKTLGYDNSADYIVNALLVQKIEKEKGFEGVWELLNVGPAEKGNEKYYKTLEKLTGITRENYNKKVWELINNEK